MVGVTGKSEEVQQRDAPLCTEQMGNGETLRTGYGDKEEYARQEIGAPVWHTPLTLISVRQLIASQLL